MNKLKLLSSLAGVILVAAPVAAAEETTAPPAAKSEEGASAATDASGDAGVATADDAGEPVKAPVEETIYVVQGKPYLVAGKFEVAPQFAQSVNDSFTSHSGVLLSGIYHLKENVAFELAGGLFGAWDVGGPRLGGRDSELTIELREKESLAPERVKLYQFSWFVAGDAQWSPFYGKVSLQDVALGQFNLYLSVGAGLLGTQLESLTQNGIQKAYVELPATLGALPPMALATTFGGGLRFYFTDWLGVRLEVRDYVIPLAVRDQGPEAVEDADGPSFDVTNLVLGQAGVSFVF